jgi:cytidylate kinase
MSLLLCFAGQIGSGKSSVSAAVADALGCRRTGFGDYLRGEITRIGGDPNDRKALQDLGQTRVDNDPAAFCREVLASGGFLAHDDFVIDGIRHVGIFHILVGIIAPTRAMLLFLGAAEATRLSRVESRTDARDFARASEHQVEAELRDALPRRADGIVNAEQPFDSVVADCLQLVQEWRRSPK